MLRSSKILTCRSSYICKWRRIKITWEAIKIRATFLALVVNLIQVVEYRPSGVVHQWMEHMIMEFQLKNSLLVTLLARWSGVKKNLMKIYKICTTVSRGQLRLKTLRLAARAISYKSNRQCRSSQRLLTAPLFTTQPSISRFVTEPSLEMSLEYQRVKNLSKHLFLQVNLPQKTMSKMMPSLCMRTSITWPTKPRLKIIS